MSELISTVITGGYCVGCGACTAVADSLEMKLTPLGMFQADVKQGRSVSDAEDQRASAVCPFSESAKSEDEIAAALFAKSCKRHSEVGYYAQGHAGYVIEDQFRTDGSSGGLGTWIAAELLRLRLVDAVLHVRPNSRPQADASPIFEFAISRSLEELRDGAKSRYYPITLADVLVRVKADPQGRYALVGVPCFIKAARLLARQDAAFAGAIHYYLGLVCGHLKSTAFAGLLAWQAGVEPGSLTGIDFRDKLEGRSARHYGFRATATHRDESVEIAKPMSDVLGGDWGLGFFKYKACDYCDDVLAETADIVIGDAWLPKYDEDWRGTNVLIVRHPVFADILANAAADGRIKIAPLSADEVARSQRSGLRHRREGLSWRLAAARRRGDWHPPKRVAAGSFDLPRDRRRIYELRELLRDLSHSAYQEARAASSLSLFVDRMRPAMRRYYRQFKPKLSVRVKNRLKRLWAGLRG